MTSISQLRLTAFVPSVLSGEPKRVAKPRGNHYSSFRSSLLLSTLAALSFWMENACPAMAATSSAQFQVGITIGKARGAAPRSSSLNVSRYTAGAAGISLKRAGFRAFRFLVESDGVYWFETLDGDVPLWISVSTTTGSIIDVIR